MLTSVQHQIEISENLRVWNSKPLLRRIYAGLYSRLVALMDRSLPGPAVEIGSGIGGLKQHLPEIIATDQFLNPWLDVICDGYEIPFRDATVSHLILFDVFHHLQTPGAFLREARRVLVPNGRLLLCEPYISWSSFLAYGIAHAEPVAWTTDINLGNTSADSQTYYAAQGNATRLFFRHEVPGWPQGWKIFHADAFSCFHYLFSGGFGKPAFYPQTWLEQLESLDVQLSRWPRLFAGRCLVGLQPEVQR